MEPVFFTKIEYKEVLGYKNPYSIILLNIPEKQLSYQVLDWKRQMSAIQGIETEKIGDMEWTSEMNKPAKLIKNGKTDFVNQVILDEELQEKVAFSYAVELNDEQMKDLLPYCNALDFEPYRNRKMEMEDPGWIGYRDEVKLYFKGITDSYIPLMELPMNYYYDEENIWPSEKLYRYLVSTFFSKNKKCRKWGPFYGAYSLFC